MKATIAITRQWQMHIPKWVREALGLDQPMPVDVEIRQGKMIISLPADSPLKDAGKYARYARRKRFKLEDIRDHIDYSQA